MLNTGEDFYGKVHKNNDENVKTRRRGEAGKSQSLIERNSRGKFQEQMLKQWKKSEMNARINDVVSGFRGKKSRQNTVNYSWI